MHRVEALKLSEAVKGFISSSYKVVTLNKDPPSGVGSDMIKHFWEKQCVDRLQPYL